MARILIVDDESLIRDVLRVICETHGHEVVEAENGDQGIDKARSETPNLIILDMNMPNMTGWEVIPLLRSHPDTKAVPVIAMTADASAESREEAHNAGCDRYITKPIDAKRLNAVMDELIG